MRYNGANEKKEVSYQVKVLFVGNSHTFFNDMPHMVKLLGAAQGIRHQ